MLLSDCNQRWNEIHRNIQQSAQSVPGVTRRTAIFLGFGAAASFAAPAYASGSTRQFTILRGGSEIGQQSISVVPSGSGIEVEINIDIAVRVLGITAYRYTMQNREVWSDGQVQSIQSTTDDDGQSHFVNAERNSSGLAIEGSEYSGTVTDTVATTTYWTTAFLNRPTWINTRDGTPLSVQINRVGSVQYPTGEGQVQSDEWRISGDLDLRLYYDQSGEWIGNRFPARGETAEFITTTPGVALTPLWNG